MSPGDVVTKAEAEPEGGGVTRLYGTATQLPTLTEAPAAQRAI